MIKLIQKHPHFYVTVFAIISSFLLGTAVVGIKIGLIYSKPISYAGFRFMLAGIILSLIFYKYLKLNEIIKNLKIIIILAFFQTFLVFGFIYFALTLIQGAIAAIIVGSLPVFTAILSHFAFHNDKMTIPKSLSLLLGVCGVISISISRQLHIQTGDRQLIGISLCLLGVICAAIGNIIVAKDKGNLNLIIFNAS